jgi:hypothetical protein
MWWCPWNDAMISSTIRGTRKMGFCANDVPKGFGIMREVREAAWTHHLVARGWRVKVAASSVLVISGEAILDLDPVILWASM